MSIELEKAVDLIERAAEELFESDSTVRSVGVIRTGAGGYGFRAVRNSAIPTPLNARTLPVREVLEIPVFYTDTFGEVESQLLVPGTGPATPSNSSSVPEVNPHSPLVCGLQIQNYDDDNREGTLQQGYMIIGTLGCFALSANGQTAALSNNHVMAGENRGLKNQDRILQSGSVAFQSAQHVATLTDFIPLQTSPACAKPHLGNVVYNEIDAAIAELEATAAWSQSYLPTRGLTSPMGTAVAKLCDQVFKVGRTTGLTYGEVVDIATIVGPVGYSPGECWFRRSITIEGLNGSQFSNKGDSGSAILRTNGEVVGILYAGNGQQTYACPIGEVFNQLNCQLA